MDRALARLQASIITNSSIRWSFTGGQLGCTRKTSQPRMDSCAGKEKLGRGPRQAHWQLDLAMKESILTGEAGAKSGNNYAACTQLAQA